MPVIFLAKVLTRNPTEKLVGGMPFFLVFFEPPVSEETE